MLYPSYRPNHENRYTYDSLGNLKKVIVNFETSEEQVVRYLVDGKNRRVGRITDSISQFWIYQDGLNPVAELDADGKVVSRFVFGSKTNAPDYMLSDKEGGHFKNYRIITNHLGSPVVIIDTAEKRLVQRYEYDEFGNVKLVFDRTTGGPLADGKWGFLFQPFGFAGGLYDDTTKLVRFGARDYDPHIGRWTAKDPILFAGDGPNLYVYVLNDPVNGFDPWGESKKMDALCYLARVMENYCYDNGYYVDEDENSRRKDKNKCPKKNPIKTPDICDDRKWDPDFFSPAIRGSDGSECVYDKNDNLIDNYGSYNFSDETIPHLCLDVLPYCKYEYNK